MPDRTLPGRRRKKATKLRHRQSEPWLRRNGAALQAYNEHIRKHGTFSDGLRLF